MQYLYQKQTMVHALRSNSAVFAIFILNFVPRTETIDCFKCLSVNHSFKACEDPFHNNYTAEIFKTPCMGGRKGRDGLYPATSCIKMTGETDNGEVITIRDCALDSGTLTTDTELVRMSHCGRFYYNQKYVRGCVQSCNDADACNNAEYFRRSTFYLSFTMIFIVIILL